MEVEPGAEAMKECCLLANSSWPESLSLIFHCFSRASCSGVVPLTVNLTFPHQPSNKETPTI